MADEIIAKALVVAKAAVEKAKKDAKTVADLAATAAKAIADAKKAANDIAVADAAMSAQNK